MRRHGAWVIAAAAAMAIGSHADPSQAEPGKPRDNPRTKSAADRADAVRKQVGERIARLRASGPDREQLRTSADTLREDWLGLAAKLNEKIEVSAWSCFAKGCSALVRHGSAQGIAATLAEFAHATTFLRWSGPKFRSAPLLLADGSVEVTWVLSAPPSGSPALLPGEGGADGATKVKRRRP